MADVNQEYIDSLQATIDTNNTSISVYKKDLVDINAEIKDINAQRKAYRDAHPDTWSNDVAYQDLWKQYQSLISELDYAQNRISQLQSTNSELQGNIDRLTTPPAAAPAPAATAADSEDPDATEEDQLTDEEAYTIDAADEEFGDDPNAESSEAEPEVSPGTVSTKSTTDAAGTASSGNEVPKPLSNPLHEYSTYTYGISLFVLSKDDYNTLVDGSSTDGWNPRYNLIAHAGGYKDIRHPAFYEDFYFDNLKMQTIVGMNNTTRGTNAVDLSFTIIEPYGLSLLDRLVAVGNDPTIGSKNYVSQPYLLQVDFFGSKELGDMHSPIPGLRKRIPIKFVEFKIKVGTKGSEYQIKAIPFSHGAFKESTNSSPANFEVKASTVGDFFSSINESSLAAQKSRLDEVRQELAAAKLDQADTGGNSARQVELTKQIEQLKAEVNKPFSTTSYAGAWNAWQQSVVDSKKVKIPNEIAFEIDSSISDSPIVDPARMNYSRVAVVDNPKTNQQSANTQVSAKTPANSFDTKKMMFNVSSGTSTVDIINLVMRNSDYIKKQVVDPLTDKNTFPDEKSIDYFKIIPKITLKAIDPQRGEYATKTTYYIVPYTYYNTKHPNLPKAKPVGSVKEYNYMYTGKNIDIIDFAIDFDTAFFTPITTNREKFEATSAAPGADDGELGDDQNKSPPGAGTVMPMVYKPQNADASVTSTGADTAKTVLVADAMKSIYSSSRGDMINVKLKILGDPHFVKQDDVYTNPGHSNANRNKVLLNPGTLNMDSGEIFCTVNFRTPIDVDDKTGLMKADPRFINAAFSGKYKVITVDSEFSKGQFVQTLDMIRIFDAVKPNDKSANTAPTTDTTTTQNVPEETVGLLEVDDPWPTGEESYETTEELAEDVYNEEEVYDFDEAMLMEDTLLDVPEISLDDWIVAEENSPDPTSSDTAA